MAEAIGNIPVAATPASLEVGAIDAPITAAVQNGLASESTLVQSAIETELNCLESLMEKIKAFFNWLLCGCGEKTIESDHPVATSESQALVSAASPETRMSDFLQKLDETLALLSTEVERSTLEKREFRTIWEGFQRAALEELMGGPLTDDLPSFEVIRENFGRFLEQLANGGEASIIHNVSALDPDLVATHFNDRTSLVLSLLRKNHLDQDNIPKDTLLVAKFFAEKLMGDEAESVKESAEVFVRGLEARVVHEVAIAALSALYTEQELPFLKDRLGDAKLLEALKKQFSK